MSHTHTDDQTVTFPAAWLEDTRLRHTELGVLIRLAATLSDRTPVARLSAQSADGTNGVTAALIRLARYGYVEHARARSPEAVRGRGWRLTEAARQGQVTA